MEEFEDMFRNFSDASFPLLPLRCFNPQYRQFFECISVTFYISSYIDLYIDIWFKEYEVLDSHGTAPNNRNIGQMPSCTVLQLTKYTTILVIPSH